MATKKKAKSKRSKKTKPKDRSREGRAYWLWPETCKLIDKLIKKHSNPHATAAEVLHPIIVKAAK